MLRLTWVVFTLITAGLLAGCGTARTPTVTFATAWQPADLRALEAPDSADPAHDLIAAYARLTQTDLEIRVDFLGSPDPFDYDLTLALDDVPGGGGRLPVQTDSPIAWDLVETFPAEGLPRAFAPDGAPAPIRPRILRDSVLDSAVIRLSRRELPANLKGASFQVFVTHPGQTQLINSIGPISVNGPVPTILQTNPPARLLVPAQARLYLAFWDALPAATPAQALRRWDGAHTGPLGQRHGLAVLLNEASATGIPLAVLDLKRPDRLAALDTLGGLPLAQRMVKEGLLEIPNLVYGDPQSATRSLAITRRAAGDFHLAASLFFYGSTSALPGDAKAAFARMKDSSHIGQWNSFRLAPLPSGLDPVDGEGLALPARQSILAAALSGDTGQVVPLGGSLPDSAWGDSVPGALAFRYLAGHPWMRVLSADDLLDLPAQNSAPECADLLCLPAPDANGLPALRQALRDSPPGLFTDLAWQAYLHLTEETNDDKLRQLRAGYLGDVDLLIAAARWNANPQEQARCDLKPLTEDPFRKGTPLCILASRQTFLVLDPAGGRLALAATQDTQLIGPRSQFAVGLSDPQDWKPELGQGGDPQEIPGAFADSPAVFQPYSSETQPGMITFTLPGGTTRKTYRLTNTGFQVQVESSAPVQTSLPIALIDREVYAPGGYARYQAGENTWSLGNTHLKISAQGAALSAQAFNESLALLRNPENPDFGYPPGHFIPFPLTVYTIQSEGSFTITLNLQPKE